MLSRKGRMTQGEGGKGDIQAKTMACTRTGKKNICQIDNTKVFSLGDTQVRSPPSTECCARGEICCKSFILPSVSPGYFYPFYRHAFRL